MVAASKTVAGCHASVMPPSCKASRGQRPTHEFDHVGVHVVGRERKVHARFAQGMGRRGAAVCLVTLRDMREMRARLAKPRDVGLRQVDAMRPDQAVIEQPDLVEQFGRRHPVTLANEIHLHTALCDVNVNP